MADGRSVIRQVFEHLGDEKICGRSNHRQGMNTTRSVKLIKNGERKDPEIQAEVEAAAGPNIWHKAVQSWVVEFQERDRSESLPAFDSLFKDALP